jgi:hypothetical protein
VLKLIFSHFTQFFLLLLLTNLIFCAKISSKVRFEPAPTGYLYPCVRTAVTIARLSFAPFLPLYYIPYHRYALAPFFPPPVIALTSEGKILKRKNEGTRNRWHDLVTPSWTAAARGVAAMIGAAAEQETVRLLAGWSPSFPTAPTGGVWLYYISVYLSCQYHFSIFLIFGRLNKSHN